LDERLIAPAIVTGGGHQKLVALDDAAEILVGYRSWMNQSVEQDGVSGLWSYSG